MIGVHYPSDTWAGRQLAGGIWNEIFKQNPSISLPTLDRVLAHAKAEWR
jgi:hypothetical protein